MTAENEASAGLRRNFSSMNNAGFDALADLPPLTDEQKDALASTAQALSTRGKGILAADESISTVRRDQGRPESRRYCENDRSVQAVRTYVYYSYLYCCTNTRFL